jgi:hypothetical protein
VHAELSFFYRVWLGAIDYSVALKSGRLVVDCLPALTRAFPRWLMWSPMARHLRSVSERELRAS